MAMTREKFVSRISELIDNSDNSQTEIAKDIGYKNSNIMTMFKRGTTRIPPDKVVPLAFALGQDPGLMLRDWFEAYMPNVMQDIDAYLVPKLARASGSA